MRAGAHGIAAGIEGEKLLCTPGSHGGTVAGVDQEGPAATLWRSQELADNATYSSLIAVDYRRRPPRPSC